MAKRETGNVLLEILVKRIIKELSDSPDRSIRNLVDLALDLSEGNFQKYFFAMAQRMLENENSAYYDLIKDVSAHVDHENLLRFGMNAGYHGLSAGVKTIRKQEVKLGCYIPWSLFLELDRERLEADPESYDKVIEEANGLGLRCWMLDLTEYTPSVISLLQNHPDNAFVLLCHPEDITEDLCCSLTELKHVMTAVSFNEQLDSVTPVLRRNKLLYSIYYSCNASAADSILKGEFFDTAEQYHPVFTGIFPDNSCDHELCEKLYEAITRHRQSQLYHTIPWDLVSDSQFVDRVISGNTCSAYFDTDGRLRTGKEAAEDLCLFTDGLTAVPKQAFPKPIRD